MPPEQPWRCHNDMCASSALFLTQAFAIGLCSFCFFTMSAIVFSSLASLKSSPWMSPPCGSPPLPRWAEQQHELRGATYSPDR